MAQFIYTMKALGKVYQPDQVVFKDIWLSFLYGAKIGVIGGNGAGKSTLLKIMAGLDSEYNGEATLSEGYTVGYLPQEPTLDPTKTVLGNVEEGVAPVRALLTRFDDINAKFGEEMSPEDMDKLLEEQARVRRPPRGRAPPGPPPPLRARAFFFAAGPRHDFEERGLARPVPADDANLRAIEK